MIFLCLYAAYTFLLYVFIWFANKSSVCVCVCVCMPLPMHLSGIHCECLTYRRSRGMPSTLLKRVVNQQTNWVSMSAVEIYYIIVLWMNCYKIRKIGSDVNKDFSPRTCTRTRTWVTRTRTRTRFRRKRLCKCHEKILRTRTQPSIFP